MASGYPRSQLPPLVGLSRRQVLHLSERAVVIPSLRGPSGRGSATLYSWEDLLVLASLGALIRVARSELGLRQAEAVAKTLAGIGQRPLDELYLVLDADSCFLVEGRLAIAELAQGSESLLLISLTAVSDQLRRDLVKAGMSGPSISAPPPASAARAVALRSSE